MRRPRLLTLTAVCAAPPTWLLLPPSLESLDRVDPTTSHTIRPTTTMGTIHMSIISNPPPQPMLKPPGPYVPCIIACLPFSSLLCFYTYRHLQNPLSHLSLIHISEPTRLRRIS